MFWRGVTERRAQVSLRQKHFGIWQSITWGEFGQYAREIGMGLVALGFEPGECASVLSNTNREWLYADMGILGAGGVSNGIYPTDAPAQVEYLCSDSSTVYCSSRTTSSSTRRSRCAPACRSCARSSCSTWTACAISTTRR